MHFGSVITVTESTIPHPHIEHIGDKATKEGKKLSLRLSNGYSFQYPLPDSPSEDLYNDILNYCNVRALHRNSRVEENRRRHSLPSSVQRRWNGSVICISSGCCFRFQSHSVHHCPDPHSRLSWQDPRLLSRVQRHHPVPHHHHSKLPFCAIAYEDPIRWKRHLSQRVCLESVAEQH